MKDSSNQYSPPLSAMQTAQMVHSWEDIGPRIYTVIQILHPWSRNRGMESAVKRFSEFWSAALCLCMNTSPSGRGSQAKTPRSKVIR